MGFHPCFYAQPRAEEKCRYAAHGARVEQERYPARSYQPRAEEKCQLNRIVIILYRIVRDFC